MLEYRSDFDLADLRSCPSCGAAVVDQDLHDRWHDSSARVAEDAHYAASMTRPIGGR